MKEIPEDIKEQARQTWNRIRNNSNRDASIIIAQALFYERKNSASIACRVCAETRHVKLGEVCSPAIPEHPKT